MSDRLTTQWTTNSEGAFGASGAKGDRGEDFLMEVFSAWNWEATCHRGLDSKSEQVKGVDITFKDPKWSNSYTCDVKANIHSTYGSFYVETDDSGWLFNRNKNSDRIWHVNPDTGWMAWYGRREMQQYIVSQGRCNTGLYRIDTNCRLSFITRRRHNVVKKAKVFDDVPF